MIYCLKEKRSEGKMYRKILVPLDGSSISEAALEHAKHIASSCNTPDVILLAVVEPKEDAIIWPMTEYDTSETDDAIVMQQKDEIRKYEKKSITTARNYLKKVAIRLLGVPMNVKIEVIVGKPEDEILDYAEKIRADLIVMSTHGRSGKSQWDLGTVAEQTIRKSDIPFLAVSSKD
jgi:nucleotide-binding universal stress UspA family protein